jgi:hypothetical protein
MKNNGNEKINIGKSRDIYAILFKSLSMDIRANRNILKYTLVP